MNLTGMGSRILADDFPALYDFYADTLGLKVKWGDRNAGYASFINPESDTDALAIFVKTGMELYPEYTPLGGQKSDRVVLIMGVEDVDAAYEKLKGKGVEFMGAPRNVPAWSMRCVYFRDPEQNLIEIAGEMK